MVGGRKHLLTLPKPVWRAVEDAAEEAGLPVGAYVEGVACRYADVPISAALQRAATGRRSSPEADTARPVDRQGAPMSERERRNKVRQILRGLNAHAPPRIADLDLSEPGTVRIKKGRERPLRIP